MAQHHYRLTGKQGALKVHENIFFVKFYLKPPHFKSYHSKMLEDMSLFLELVEKKNRMCPSERNRSASHRRKNDNRKF